MPNVKDKISKFYSLESDKERILVIGHQADMFGGEILVKNIIDELKRQDVEVVAFIKKDGPMIDTYEKLAPTLIIDNESEIEDYVKELNKYGFDSAIVNTVISGNFIPYLKKHDYYTPQIPETTMGKSSREPAAPDSLRMLPAGILTEK